MISAVQWFRSVCVCVCVCVCILLHIFFHCSLSQVIGYSSLCRTSGPCLSVPFASSRLLTASPQSVPILQHPLWQMQSVLYVCESTSASWRSSSVSWFRFYLYAVSHGIYLSLSDLLCWGWSFNLIHFNETNESVDLALVFGGQQGPDPCVWRVLIVWIVVSTAIRNKWETESEMSQHHLTPLIPAQPSPHGSIHEKAGEY